MKQLRRFRIAAFTLVLLSIVGFCTAQRSAGMLLAAGAIAALSWYVTEGPRGRTLPRWVSNVLLFAVLINSAVDLLTNSDQPMAVLGRFQIWLILVKLYERKTARDYSQLLTLSVILMITACTAGQDLLFGVVLILYAVLGFHVLISYQLYAGLERAQLERKNAAPAGYRLVPPVRPVTGRMAQSQMRWLVPIAGSIVFLFSALMFVGMPRSTAAGRIGERAMGLFEGADEGTYRSGFESKLDLRTGSTVLESRKPVLTMRLFDSEGKPYHSPEPMRLRAVTMERARRNDPSSWTQSTTELRSEQSISYRAGATHTFADVDDKAEAVITQQIQLLARTDYIFALYVPVSYSGSRSHAMTYYPRMQVMSLASGGRVTDYTVRSATKPSAATMEQLHNGSLHRLSTRWRYQNPAIRQLAISLLNDAGMQPFRPGDEHEAWDWNNHAAQVFRDFLQSDRFSYSTDLSDVEPPDPDTAAARDPIVHFLFNTRRGYCAHFASALVAMCQSVQIHARIVSGYIAYEYDGTMGHYIVRESNAHTWTEVRTGDYEWSTFDPTPSATISSIHAAQHSFADRLQLFYDGLEFQWDNGVVGFDYQAQAQLRDWFANISNTLFVARWEALRDRVSRFTRGFIFDFGWTGGLWMMIVLIALVLAVYVLLRLMRRTRKLRQSLHIQHLRGREYRVMLRQLGFYLDMLRTLRKRGWAKPAWKTPMQLADDLESRHPRAAQLVRDITATFYTVRFGGRALEPAQVQHAETMIAELEKSL